GQLALDASSPLLYRGPQNASLLHQVSEDFSGPLRRKHAIRDYLQDGVFQPLRTDAVTRALLLTGPRRGPAVVVTVGIGAACRPLARGFELIAGPAATAGHMASEKQGTRRRAPAAVLRVSLLA